MNVHKGVVVEGSKRATALGFPTVNIPLQDDSSGIYIARVLAKGMEYPAAVYADPSRKVLEAHLIGFEGALYGEEIAITPVEKLREARKFDTDDAAKEAIAADVAAVRAYFKV